MEPRFKSWVMGHVAAVAGTSAWYIDTSILSVPFTALTLLICYPACI